MPLLLRAVSLLLYVCGVARSVETATGGLFRARAPTTEEISLVLQEAEDQFNSLSESELRELGALYSSTDSIRAKMRELNKFEAITHIDVKLVGFDGDGNLGAVLDERELDLHFQSLRKEHHSAHIIDVDPAPENGQAAAHGTKTHDLPIRIKHLYHVSKAPRLLATTLATRLQELAPVHSGLVAASEVEAILRQDFERGAGSPSYVVYVLNTMPPRDALTGTRLPYVYVREPTQLRAGGARTAGHAGGAKGGDPPRSRLCGTNTWASSSRFLWIDLGAHRSSFGPLTSGTGLVTYESFPSLPLPTLRHNADPVGATTVGTADERGEENARRMMSRSFMADTVAAVHRAALQLISPSLQHFPVPFHQRVVVQLVVLRERRARQTPTLEAGPWAELARQLESLSHSSQNVTVQMHEIGFNAALAAGAGDADGSGSDGGCDFCVAALTHSLRSHTSNVVADGLRTQVHRYIDSAELHRWLQHFDSEFWSLRTSSDAELVLPVFLFDLKSPEMVLLDRFHQAVHFKDMVLAVQTQAPTAAVDFSCDRRQMVFEPQDARRAILAAVLQSVWGVAATHESWDPLKSAVAADFSFSAGPTPFGYFSDRESLDLSFSQRDATLRHMVFSEIARTLSHVRALLGGVARFDKTLEELLPSAVHLLFVQRWNFFSWKLQRAGSALSLHNLDMSLYHLKSLQADLHALDALSHLATARLRTSLQCTSQRHSALRATTRDMAFGVLGATAFGALVAAAMLWWPRSKQAGGRKASHRRRLH